MAGKSTLVVLGWLLLALASLLPSHVLADGRVALVIANSDYKGAPLPNPEVDLGLIVPALEEMGFVVQHVADADLVKFDRALNDFAETAKNADIALFYFAGHGFALNDGLSVSSYLMSTDANVTSPSDRVIQSGGIKLDSIIGQLTAVAKTTLIFVDACRNDPRVGRSAGSQGRGFAPISHVAQGDVFVGLSTRLGSIAADGKPGQGSPFAHAFVKHIGEPGLNVAFAFNKVRLAVQQSTNGVQSPETARVDLSDPGKVVLRSAAIPGGGGNGGGGTAGGSGAGGSRNNGNSTGGDSLARIEEAARVWESVRTTESVAILKKFAAQYAGTVYADFAEIRVTELQPKLKPEEPDPEASKDIAVIEPQEEWQPPFSQPDRLALYTGLDFYGGDIANRREFDAVQCAHACIGNGQCRAFTFNTRTRTGPNCFLKDGVARLEAYDGALAGVIVPSGSPDPETLSFPAIDPTQDVFNDTDIPFNDIRQTPWPGVTSSTECRQACIDTDSCEAFSFVTRLKQCWLKHTVGQSRTMRGVVTGIKRWVNFEVTRVVTLD